MSEHHYLRAPSLVGTDIEAKRQQIAEYFNATFERYESLFETLVDDRAYYQKSIPLRHPLIFYYGHTATFFVNKLMLAGLIEHRVDPKLESMFAIGVDEMSWDDLNDTHYVWPKVSEVKIYRQQVKQLVNDVIAHAPLALPINWQNPWWTIIMGIEHEQIHLETSSVLIRQQALSLVQKQDAWRPWTKTAVAPENRLVDIPSGQVSLGKDYDDPIYGWDNEYGQHHADIAAFQASQYLVSNQEFVEFVDEGGYEEDSYWLPEGMRWRDYAQAKHPAFWIKSVSGWRLRLMSEVINMPWDWPVEVNFHEAKAFCNWKAAQTGDPVRLPTEDEWQRIYDYAGIMELDEQQANANIHLDYAASSCPVNQFCHGDLYDVIGNVWQWTETAIYPFEGFKVHPLYDDFTMPTFDGRHNLFKGGSWISCGNESRHASRYAFRRHFFQHAGFRYIVAESNVEQAESSYETDKMLSEYAEFHYGDRYFDVDNFPETLADRKSVV